MNCKPFVRPSCQTSAESLGDCNNYQYDRGNYQRLNYGGDFLSWMVVGIMRKVLVKIKILNQPELLPLSRDSKCVETLMRFQPQGRRFINFLYYYLLLVCSLLWKSWCTLPLDYLSAEAFKDRRLNITVIIISCGINDKYIPWAGDGGGGGGGGGARQGCNLHSAV